MADKPWRISPRQGHASQDWSWVRLHGLAGMHDGESSWRAEQGGTLCPAGTSQGFHSAIFGMRVSSSSHCSISCSSCMVNCSSTSSSLASESTAFSLRFEQDFCKLCEYADGERDSMSLCTSRNETRCPSTANELAIAGEWRIPISLPLSPSNRIPGLMAHLHH